MFEFEEHRNSFLIIGVTAVILIIGISVISYRLLQSRRMSGENGNQVACTLEAKICPDGTAVGRTGPNCAFAACPNESAPQTPKNASCSPGNLRVKVPLDGARVGSTFRIEGTVDNRTNKDCTWTLFEGRAGSVEVRDVNGAVVGQAPLETEGDWMTDGPVEVEATVKLQGKPVGPTLSVVISEENPSGEGVPQQVTFKVNY